MPYRRRSLRWGRRVAVVLSTLVVLGAAAYSAHLAFRAPVAPALPPRGVDGDGVASLLTPAAEPLVNRLEARSHCGWATPGRRPYTGDAASALVALNVPLHVAERVLQMRRSRERTGYVTVMNEESWSTRGVKYSTWMGMTFGGGTICYGTRANFADQLHAERGELYVVDGYHVAIMDACGNWVRFIPMPESIYNDGPARRAVPLLVPLVPRRAQLWEPVPHDVLTAAVSYVPEPPVWLLFTAGAGMMYVVKRFAERQRKKRFRI